MQDIILPGMLQEDAGQQSSAEPSLPHEGHSMPMAGPALRKEAALCAEALAHDSSHAVQHGDRWDSQQQQGLPTLQEALEQDRQTGRLHPEATSVGKEVH